MPPPTDKKRVLYDAVSKEYNLGTYEDFEQKLQDPNKRKVLYQTVGTKYNLGGYDDFEVKLGYGQSQQPSGLQSAGGILKPQGTYTQEQPKDLLQQVREQAKPEGGVPTIHNTLVSPVDKAVDTHIAKMNKGFPSTKEGEQVQRDALSKQIQNGDLVVRKDADGEPVLKKSIGFFQSIKKGIDDTYMANLENDVFAQRTPEEKIVYLNNKRANPDFYGKTEDIATNPAGSFIGENASLLGKGTVGAMGATIAAPAAIGAGAFGSYLGIVNDVTNSGYKNNFERTYNNLKDQGMSDADAAEAAGKAGLGGAATQQAVGAVLSAPMGKLLLPKAVEESGLQVIGSTLKKVLGKDAPKMALATGAGTLAEGAARKAVGSDEKPMEILTEGVQSAGHGYVTGAIFGVPHLVSAAFSAMANPKSVPSQIRPQLENVIAEMQPEQRQGIAKAAEANGAAPDGFAATVEANAERFKNAKAPYVSLPIAEEKKAALAGKQIQLSKAETPEQASKIQEEIKEIFEAKNPLDVEKDSDTGEYIEHLGRPTTVGEMLDKTGTYKGEKGSFIQDGQAIVFKVEGKNKEYELGNVEELRDTPLAEMDIQHDMSAVSLNGKGNIEVRGKEYLNNYSDKLQAVNRDADGNVISVNLETADGKKRTFRGGVAEDIAYQLSLKEKSNETKASTQEPAIEATEGSPSIAGEEPQPIEQPRIEEPIPVQAETIEPTKNEAAIVSQTPKKEQPIAAPKPDVLRGTSKEKPNNEQAVQVSDTTKAEPAPAPKEKTKEPDPPSEPPMEKVEPDKGGGDDEWTAIRQEKLKEIDKVKKLFEKEKGTTWTAIQQEALESVAEEYPHKNIYEAVKAKTETIAAKYDGKVDYNPTAKDLAVIQEFKRQTEKKISNLEEALKSDDDITRNAAMLEMDGYENDLLNVGKASFKKEAGTAFGYRQSESKMDADYGLQIRRNQLMRKQGGQKLSAEQDAWTKEQWEKEKAIMQKEQELREKGMQEEFEKQINELKDKFQKGGAASASKEKLGGKSLTQKGKEVADRLRKLKTDKDSLKMDFTLGTWDLAVEGIAKLVEGGATIAEAIEKLIKDKAIGFKTDKDKQSFEKMLLNALGRDEVREKIEAMANEAGEKNVTNDMVAKGLIRDFVNSHIGQFEGKDLLEQATKDLKKVLPEVDKKTLIEAYLKEGEFKQPSKAELESSLTKAKKELQSIAKLTEDIEDLEGLKTLRQRSFPTERERVAYEKELFDKKKALLKEQNDRRRQILADNKKLESVKIKEDDKIQAGKDKLAEIDANIERAKKDLDLINTYKNKSETGINEELEAKRRELKRTVRDNSSEERLQADALARAKKKAESDIRMYERKIKDGEYTEHTPVHVKKADIELIKLQKDKSNIEAVYRKKQKELEEKNKTGLERAADFGRGLYVAALIGGLHTFEKVGAMSIMRPFSEAATKGTFGKVFDLFFSNISRAAKRGGESSSFRSMKSGFGGVFKQMGEQKMQEHFNKAAKEFFAAETKFNEYKSSGGADKAELSRLESDMNNKRLAAMGNLIYQFIGGSSFKDAYDALVHRSNVIETKYGGIEKESFKDGNWLDKTAYVLNFVGRSHSALKTFSGRFSFAAGFMARLEAAVKDGIELPPDKMIEIAHESYLDFERGKYQQSNYISDKWNHITKSLNQKMSENPEWNKYNKAAEALLRSEVAITRVPVNILHEAVMEYTLGTFRALYMAHKAAGEAKVAAKLEGIVDSPKLKERVKELVSQMDAKQAATIARCFRKGGFGLGMYALMGLTGIMHFGGFQYLGQRKKKEEGDLTKDELNPNQIMFGDDKWGEATSGIVSHIPALWPMFMGTGMAYIYNQDLKKGKSGKEAALDAFYTHLKIIEGGIPQSKIVQPSVIAKNAAQAGKKRLDEWGLLTDKQFEATEIDDFLTEKKIKIAPVTHLTIKDSKHPNGEYSYKELEDYKTIRTDKLQSALSAAMKGNYFKGMTDEEIKEEVKWMTTIANKQAHEKVFGKKEKTDEEIEKDQEESQRRKEFKADNFEEEKD